MMRYSSDIQLLYTALIYIYLNLDAVLLELQCILEYSESIPGHA